MQKGFTIIELIVLFTIAGLLIAIIWINVEKYMEGTENVIETRQCEKAKANYIYYLENFK